MSRTYEFTKDYRAIKCLRCGRTSHNSNDVRMKFCGACKMHEGDLTEVRLYVFAPSAFSQPVLGCCRLPRTPAYDELRAVLDPYFERPRTRTGAPFEHVSVLFHDAPHDMFVDETGAHDQLPRNEPATAIYRAFWLSVHPDEAPEELPAIYGPAVVTGRRVWF
jgi:hypothetical protein